MVALTQPSFAGGELAPSLYGRVDLAKYSVGLRLARNFIIQAHGGATNRPGTTFVCEVKDSARQVRLIPFSFNTEQTYILEFGHLYMRVITNGGQVVSGGSPYEIATPYGEDDLPLLKFVQSADVMTICHPDHAPRELARTAHDNWALTVIAFAPSIATPTGQSATVVGTGGSTTYKYKVTAVAEESLEESLPTAEIVVTNGNANLSATNYNRIDWLAVAGAQEYNVYKSENGIFGWIGTSEVAGGFRDTNIKPDLSDTPPGARNPFSGAGNYPGCTDYFEQRRVFAASRNKPQTFWMTQSGNLYNFNVSSPTRDDDAITRTIAARQVNEIRGIVPMADLILLTSGAEWRVTSGGQGDVMTPANVKATPQSYFGSSHLPPIVAGGRLLFVQDKGQVVRDLGYEFSSDSYGGRDLSILANHLFDGRELKEWAWAYRPWSVIWCVRDDGTLLSFTYMPEHEVAAWSRHETDGAFESVAVVAEGQEHVPYFVVRRTINGVEKRYIERLHTRQFATIADAYFVDCGLSYDGAPATVFSGLDHLEGKTVAILGDGNVMPPAVVEGGQVTLQRAVSKCHVGLPYDCDLQTLPVDLGQGAGSVQGRKKRIAKVFLRLERSRGLWAGPDADTLTEWKQRQDEAMGDPILPLTGTMEILIDPRWDTDGSIWIGVRDPLPATILSATPEVEIGS